MKNVVCCGFSYMIFSIQAPKQLYSLISTLFDTITSNRQTNTVGRKSVYCCTHTFFILSHHATRVPYHANIMELMKSTLIMAIECATYSETSSSGDKVEYQHHDTSTIGEWNRNCFQIVHTRHQDNETTPKPQQAYQPHQL